MKLNKKVIARTVLCAVLVSALGYSFVAKSETKLLPFQGKLTDVSGQVVKDGTILVEFRMFDDPERGLPKWNGERQMLTVNNGFVSTALGTKASLKNVDFSTPTYLEIRIDANGDGQIGPEDPPLLPRQSIIPAVYAVEAGNVQTLNGYDWSSIFGENNPEKPIPGDKIEDQGITTMQLANKAVTTEKVADSSITSTKLASDSVTAEKIADEVISEEKLIKKVRDSLVPPGTIISFGGENVPDGWLECDGRPLNSKDYPALYQAIGKSWGSGIILKNGEQVQSQDHDFNLPELHGVFLRGWNSYMKDTRINDPDVDGRWAPILGGATGNHVGSYQNDAFQSHNHKVYLADWLNKSSRRIKRTVPDPANDGVTTNPFSRDNSPSDVYAAEEINVTDSNPVRPANETRPKNAYVNYIIKY